MRAAGEAVGSGDPAKMQAAVTTLQDTMTRVGKAQTALTTAVDG